MNQEVFQNFPTLKTETLVLDRIDPDAHPEEFKEIVSYRTNPKASNDPEAVFKKTELDYANKESINWGVHLNGELIAFCGYFRGFKDDIGEIGYVMRHEFRNSGLMSDATKAVIKCGFEQMDLVQIDAFTALDNEPSVRMLKTLGFEETEDMHEHYTKFSLRRDDWAAN